MLSSKEQLFFAGKINYIPITISEYLIIFPFFIDSQKNCINRVYC